MPGDGLTIVGPRVPGLESVLTREALAFVATLERRFGGPRAELLAARERRRAAFRSGELPDFLAATEAIRGAEWQVAPAPGDLLDRRVEITGPVERKMMINALNSGAQVFMADFEDALSPTWENVLAGQQNCQDAVRGRISYTAPDGKQYALGPSPATLVMRPRGWHLAEKHVLLSGRPVSASLFDFGVYFAANAAELLRRGSGPYFYLPKLESHLEARLWNEVFRFSQEELGLPPGSVRATVLIETAPAAFEMDEILYELCEHAAGLNAGRWDYIFSMLKNFGQRADFLLPDRSQITMTVPFMRAYTDLLVRTCHRRGAHAIGGMAAFIPSRRDADVNARAFERVREDKTREATDGFDGSWVAHPDLVPVARKAFDAVLGVRPNQKERLRPEVHVTAKQLLDVRIPGGKVTQAGVRGNIRVALEYIENWLEGRGAVGIANLMEDSATAEISRMQLRQWVSRGVELEADGRCSAALYQRLRQEEAARLVAERGVAGRMEDAARLLDRLVTGDVVEEFLTIPAYEALR